MAGKAPLLLAMVLFAVGAAGLALTSAERASWGPFQPRTEALAEQRVVHFDVGSPLVEPPPLLELFTSFPAETAIAAATPEAYVYVAPTEEPTPAEVAATPTPLPPLVVHGISADDGGVAAAGATPTPPPPIFIGGISADSEPSSETPAPEVSETPTPEESPAPEATPSPAE